MKEMVLKANFFQGWIMANLLTEAETTMRKEIDRLREAVRACNRRLENGRHYLMGVPVSKITAEDALEAFGWTRNGMEE